MKMLILFKERPKMSYKETSELIGYSDRQLKRWWKKYKEGGVEGLLEIKKRGRKEGVSEEKKRVIEGLREKITLFCPIKIT
ncbi:MAG: helix-turn-helix domain-containing protein, partial [Thermotogae bacterium]|nr:helix-turn-helix domain-containing protein [Thermotogota bacterium]